MARKEKPVDTTTMEAEVRFLTTYGDAITLLMALFVMLYAMSQVDAHKFQLLVSGLQDPFKNDSVSEGLLEAGPGIVGPGADFAAESSPPPGLELVPGGAEADSPAEELAEEAPADERFLSSTEELEKVREALDAALEAFGLDPEVSARLDSRGLVVSIATDDVLFASGSPDLSQAGREVIGALAPILAEFDNELLIEGHTDAVPLDDAGYTNWNLSADRALSVLEMLESSDINPGRLSATGYGEYRPIGDNATEDGRAANRRVELVIVAGDPGTETMEN
jgi:chemotaxis protein MotB